MKEIRVNLPAETTGADIREVTFCLDRKCGCFTGTTHCIRKKKRFLTIKIAAFHHLTVTDKKKQQTIIGVHILKFKYV